MDDKYNTWFKKMLIKNENKVALEPVNPVVLVEPIIGTINYEKKLSDFNAVVALKIKSTPEEQITKEIAINNRINRELTIKNILQKINNYDIDKKSTNSEHISHTEGLLLEVDKSEDSQQLDKKLDILHQIKYNHNYVEVDDKPSQYILDEIAEQEKNAETRKLDFIIRNKSIRDSIRIYDNGKKDKDPNFISYDNVELNFDTKLSTINIDEVQRLNDETNIPNSNILIWS